MDPWSTEGDPREAARRVRALMRGFPRAWYFAGSWALGIYIRRILRPREDVEIAVFREDQGSLRAHLAGWEFEKERPPEQGRGREAWREGEWLAAPVYGFRAGRSAGDPRRLRVRLMELTEGTWRFRRDLRVARPLAEIGLVGCEGMPILAPEVALLCGAETRRPEDEEDFRNAREVMGPDRRRWLLKALGTAYPAHPWIEALVEAPAA